MLTIVEQQTLQGGRQMSKQQLKHDSLQDKDSIRAYLEQVIQGLENGRIRFSNGDDVFELEPEALIHLQLNATRSKDQQQLNIKLSWDRNPKKDNKAEKLTIG